MRRSSLAKIQLSEYFSYGKLLRFTLPSIAMMIFTSINGVVDGIFVSNFAGKTPFAAINLIMPYIMIFGTIGFTVGTGGTALISKTLGMGDRKKANEIFSMLTAFCVISGILLTVISILFYSILFLWPAADLFRTGWHLVCDCGRGVGSSAADALLLHPATQKLACLALNGEAFPGADISYAIELLDGLRVLVQLWHGDEEFLPRLCCLWDENVTRYIRYETTWYAIGLLIKRIREYIIES